jgi:hypothetical protein
MLSGGNNTALNVTALAREAVTLVFELYAEVVLAGTYYRSAQSHTAVSMLAMPVPVARVDGTVIKPGDELVLIQAADLTAIEEPRAGDYVVESVTSLRRDVIVAQLDLSRQIWSLVARKVFVVAQ